MADTSTHNWKLLYEAGRQALQAKKLQPAEQSFSAALQLAEDFAAGDPRLAATLNALARIYSLQRRYLAAAALLNRLLEVTERTLGTSHVQVAGVLTNLAEMYTHLGAAREELELRERVLGIRAADPNADPQSLDRLRERVTELRTILASQEPPASADDDDLDRLPTITTAERALPAAPVVESAPMTAPTVAADYGVAKEKPSTLEADAMYRISPVTAALAIAPWPGAAATGTTPTGGKTVNQPAADVAEVAAVMPSSVAIIPVSHEMSLPMGPMTEHGFGDGGRTERHSALVRKMVARPSLISMAAGVLLVAGLLAARGFVSGSDDERESTGSVNLATSTATAVAPPAAPAAQTPPSEDQRTVEHVVAEQRAAREARRAAESQASDRDESARDRRDVIAERAPRAPSSAELERTLRGLDGAVRAIDQRTKAATDSASALRLQTPTFKKEKLAEP